MWSWTANAFYLIRAGRATVNIQMPPGCTLKHITYDRCKYTGDVILRGQLTANNNLDPPYNGSLRTETDGGFTGNGGTGGTGEHHRPSGGDDGGTIEREREAQAHPTRPYASSVQGLR